MTDNPNLWSIAVGLARLDGDETETSQSYVAAFESIKDIDSTLENKMMAAEIMVASKLGVNEAASAVHALAGQVRSFKDVPREQVAGVAAILMVGKRYDGTYPTDRFVWAKDHATKSLEAAAILAIHEVDLDQLNAKFQAFRSLFGSFGYTESEDLELASAFLACSELQPEEVRTKLSILLDSLKNYLQYPLVPGAILGAISSLEANETMELAERAYAIIAKAAPELDRTALLTLAVRMVPGVENKLVKKLDATPKAEAAATGPEMVGAYHPMLFPFYWIVLNHSYYARYTGYAAAHPAHSHGVGGFAG